MRKSEAWRCPRKPFHVSVIQAQRSPRVGERGQLQRAMRALIALALAKLWLLLAVINSDIDNILVRKGRSLRAHHVGHSAFSQPVAISVQ